MATDNLSADNLSATFKFKILVFYDNDEQPVYYEQTRSLKFDDFIIYCNILCNLFRHFEVSVTEINNLPF